MFTQPLPDIARAFTVFAPYAQLIVAGRKRIENRAQPTNHRGLVLIHAGLRQTYAGESAQVVAQRFGVESLVFGAVVGVAVVVDCVRLEHLASRYPELLADGHALHAVGPWCWILADAVPLATPVPMKGRLSVFQLDRLALAQVASQARPINATIPHLKAGAA